VDLAAAAGSRCRSGLEQIPGCRERWMAGISGAAAGDGWGRGGDVCRAGVIQGWRVQRAGKAGRGSLGGGSGC